MKWLLLLSAFALLFLSACAPPQNECIVAAATQPVVVEDGRTEIELFLPGSLIIEEFETDDTDPDMEQFVFTNTSGIRVLIVIVERPLSTGMFGEQTLESHLINSGDSFSGVFDSSRVGVYVYHASTSSGGALAGFARFDR